MNYAIQLGQLIDNRYRINAVLSMGGYGIVWQGWHEKLDLPLAIKMIDVSQTDPATVERIERECKIGGQLGDQPGVVRVLDALREGPYLLIVMDLMEGGDLAARMYDRAVPFDQALEWALTLCDALLAVHAKGIIHRDIKPQNILLDTHNRVKLCDFGVANVSRSHLTGGHQPGTPAYKAPELDQGSPPTPAADVYSLCAVLFQLWSGRLFADYKALDQDLVRTEFIAALSEQHGGVSEQARGALATAILGGLKPGTAQRYTLQVLREQLQVISDPLDTEGTIAPSPPATVAPRPTLTLMPPMVAPVAGVSKTAVVEWLVQEVEHAFQEEIWNGRRRRLFFWYDPAGDWSAVVPLLAARVPLLIDRGSLLEMRYELERHGDNEPIVLYLRRAPQDASYLTPYEILAQKLDLEPYDFLRRYGAPLPAGHARHELKPLLPQLLAISTGQGEEFWQSIRSAPQARAKLLPDLQERVFRMLAAPSATLSDLLSQGQDVLFADRLLEQYGYSNPAVEPDVFARGLFAQWCLVDIFLHYGKPAGFPLQSALPAANVWSRCRDALRSFRNDRRYLAVVAQLGREVEQQYTEVVGWARQQEQSYDDAPLQGIALISLERAYTRLSNCKRHEDLIALLQVEAPSYRIAAGGFWPQQGYLLGWSTLLLGAEVVLGANTARMESASLRVIGDFVAAYTQRWMFVDLNYRRYRMLPQSNGSASVLARWVAVDYRLYLEHTNRAWSQALTDTSLWPPAGAPESQLSTWAAISGGKGRRSVFFVDALRYDLASELAAALTSGGKVKVDINARTAGLPSITPLGMAGLLPRAEKQKVDWQGKWEISTPDFNGNLAEKRARSDLLQTDLRGASAVELHDLLQPQVRIEPDTSWLLVFSQEIDEVGENASELVLDVLGTTVQRLVQGVRKVLDAGFEAVHVVTDHGFLLLEEVIDSDKLDVPIVEALKLGQRYLLGRNLTERSDVLRFPVRGSADLWGYYPYGITAFSTPGRYNYSHGGPTLHEIIIPHVVVHREQQRKTGVRLVLPERVHAGIFRAELQPIGQMFDMPRDVRVAIENLDGTRLRENEATITPAGPVSLNMRLAPTDKIGQDEAIVLVVRDAETAEELDRGTVIVQALLEL